MHNRTIVFRPIKIKFSTETDLIKLQNYCIFESMNFLNKRRLIMLRVLYIL